MTIDEYVVAHAGCATRMLIGEIRSTIHCGDEPTFEPEDKLEDALEVLGKFSFVGLTEEWALSMCLFNKMLNTKCRAEQGWNNLNSTNKTSDEHDTSILNGWVVEYD